MYFIHLLFKYEFTYTSRALHAPFAILRDSERATFEKKRKIKAKISQFQSQNLSPEK